MVDLIKLDEPALLFGHNQTVEDPRDGLSLFGPLEHGRPGDIRYGLIGTMSGIQQFKEMARTMQNPIFAPTPSRLRPPFPGFESVFGARLASSPCIVSQVSDSELTQALHIGDGHQRVFRVVDLYATAIAKAAREEEERIDLWFVVVPDDVYTYCRPQSRVEQELRTHIQTWLSPQTARRLVTIPSLFPEDNEAARPYQFDVNFRNQLKARVLHGNVPIQILRESTAAWVVGSKDKQDYHRRLDCRSTVAWNIATAVFYKAIGRPWKMAGIRDGVCYIGLAFKHVDTAADKRTACCAAQMFLDSGDGIVFKGAVGPWFNKDRGDYHLSRRAAEELATLALETYTSKNGNPPTELFIHGQVRFDDEEWLGFSQGIGAQTKLVGVRIRSTNDLKLYRMSTHPILRGLAYVRDERTAYLWTRGFVPRLGTYPGMEVPNPLVVDVCRGSVYIRTVLADILALTKLNYNACIFADGIPVTLRFADSVGEILTAGPLQKDAPLPFKFYI